MDDSNTELPTLDQSPPYSISTTFITPQDVRDAISNIDPSKSCGPDLISPRLLREGSEVLSQPLSTYFNKLIAAAYFPSTWKLANVVPIFKKADPSNPQNYRPISPTKLYRQTYGAMHPYALIQIYNRQ